MKVAFARFISFLFNPLLVLLFVSYLLVYKGTDDLYKSFIWTMYTLIFLLAMTVFMIYGVRKGIFTDLDVSKREQRPLLFLVSVIFGILYLTGLFFFDGPFILLITTFGIIFGIFLASIINTQIKASLHVATISALLFSLAFVYGGLYFLLLLLIPLVGWARVKAKKHTVSETIIGGILGSLLSLGMYFVVRFFFL